MRLDDDQLLALMAVSLRSLTTSIPNAVSLAENVRREVESRQPHPDCLCVHAIPDFDGIHHDSRCEKFSEAANAAYEDGYAAALDETIAVCRKYQAGLELDTNKAAVEFAIERIEALKSQPSKEE